MKKQILGTLLFAGLYCGSANAQGLKCLSAEVHAGINAINDVNHCPEGWGKSIHVHPQFGVEAQYDFNNYIGAGVDYTFLNNNQWNYDNRVNNWNFYLSSNITNIISPRRPAKFQPLNIYLNAGIGISKASWSDVTDPETGKSLPDDSKYTCPNFLLGGVIEYNINTRYALSLNTQLRSYFREPKAYDSECFHPTTEGGKVIFSTGLGFRYKVADEHNVRNSKPFASRDFSEYSKWSIEAHGGANFLRNTNRDNGGDMNPQVGVEGEYDFSPTFGLGLDYTWMKNNQYNYDNNIHNFELFSSINVINFFTRSRSGLLKHLNIYLKPGIGEDVATWANTFDPETGEKQEDGSNFSYPHCVVGLAFEYSMDKYLSVGLNTSYRYYFGEPVETGAGNCFHPTLNGGQSIFSVGIGIRYKFLKDMNVRDCPRF